MESKNDDVSASRRGYDDNEDSLVTLQCAGQMVLDKVSRWLTSELGSDYKSSMVRGRSASFVKHMSGAPLTAEIIVKTVMENWQTKLRASISVSRKEYSSAVDDSSNGPSANYGRQAGYEHGRVRDDSLPSTNDKLVSSRSVDYWVLMDFPVLGYKSDDEGARDDGMLVPMDLVEAYEPDMGRERLDIDDSSDDSWDPSIPSANSDRLARALSLATSSRS